MDGALPSNQARVLFFFFFPSSVFLSLSLSLSIYIYTYIITLQIYRNKYFEGFLTLSIREAKLFSLLVNILDVRETIWFDTKSTFGHQGAEIKWVILTAPRFFTLKCRHVHMQWPSSNNLPLRTYKSDQRKIKIHTILFFKKIHTILYTRDS